jgi:hypothetical protein
MHSIRALSAMDRGESAVLIFLGFYIDLKVWGL